MGELKKVLIAVISNRGQWPKQFALSLIELINETRKDFYVEYFVISSCDVNHMRNLACLLSINQGKQPRGFKFDYLVQLDDDHMYPADFIKKFIEFDKDVVVGCTSQRNPPFGPTQYYEFNFIDMKEEKNLCRFKGNEGLVKIKASGPVGMVMKTDVLEKLEYPYFSQIDVGTPGNFIGGDIFFSKQLEDHGIEMFCDSSTSFPHGLGEGPYSDRGEVRFIK